MSESDPLEGSKGRGGAGGASLPLASLFPGHISASGSLSISLQGE